MKYGLTASAALCLVLGLPFAAAADPLALVLANEDYRRASDVRRGDEPADATGRLAAAGVTVLSLADGNRDETLSALSEFGQMASAADRLLVVLSGRFVASSTETYFLPTDTGPEPLATLPGASLPLSTVMAYLAEKPGQALLILATDGTAGDFGPLLSIGTGALDIPQGVTVLEGTPRDVARFLSGPLARPGAALDTIAEDADLTVSGFLADGQAFLTEVARPRPEPPAPAPEPDADQTRADIRAWREADAAGTAEAYRTYLDAFPDGQFRIMAETRIDALVDTPEARAEREEAALDLSRDARREIQRDLSLLDYNTRGIDGIFGRGTRGAIGAWQEANGLDATGFLTRDQITRLDAQAERRAVELEIEAERRRQEQLAADRAFWQETGAAGDEAGLTAYLERFPDGEFAEEARAELDRIEQSKRANASALDRQLWDEARSQDSPQAYRDYLEVQPDGAFRAEAEARIRELESAAAQSDTQRRAAAEEQALNLSAQSRRLIEQRLASLDLRPGSVDGVFDDDTRRALRRYQAARNLPETGYLSEAVVVQLLADSVRSIFR
ncbi:peptidoglycan-binding protein [Alphaproteobacteria bacterium GH1-50]|uniref:Peptidoglycan-binding protein n=1 Tax=Kangsaoukella pontilimi TaxID=2691042 RepID=A0A7C9MSN6_9RHOB|nr:peptidoglycan-binding protein [Kangsaoukella pontilimi]MXQ09477.1 peptidoglycan-binding protein [Kangsaoukella pontilimi]